jgi:formylglycine-generating enzyme required for sulfatase activity
MLQWLVLPLLLLPWAAQQRDFQIERTPRRVALLIGNNKYPKQPLANAINDASDLSQALRETGFETELILDADLRTMDLGIQRFVGQLRPGDVALFYFSGHGISVEGENFLLPVSFAAEMEADVRYQAYSAARVRDLVRARNVQLSILVLDACRSNPFRASRSGSGGLSGMSGAGAFIAFAADEGRTADDNPRERNGLFTKHLLREIKTPGLGLESLFTRVRRRVHEESQGRQVPFSYSGLLGDFAFVPAPPPAPPKPEPKPPEPKVIPKAEPKPEAPATPPPAPASPETLPSFGEKRLNAKDGLNYVYIPPGRSVIGCHPASTCQEGDLPGREVQTTTGFWIGETEVTREAFLKVMGSAPPLRLSAHLKMPVVLQGRLPVTDITAAQAHQYCRAIGLRLPTEFEWEFAARAGLGVSQPEPIEDFAWLAPANTSSVQKLLEGGASTRPVAQKQPNLWGLYDMLGNAGEFTLLTEDQRRISVRGGSFVQTPDKVRYARRFLLPEGDTTYMNFSFRCAGPSL